MDVRKLQRARLPLETCMYTSRQKSLGSRADWLTDGARGRMQIVRGYFHLSRSFAEECCLTSLWPQSCASRRDLKSRYSGRLLANPVSSPSPSKGTGSDDSGGPSSHALLASLAHAKGWLCMLKRYSQRVARRSKLHFSRSAR